MQKQEDEQKISVDNESFSEEVIIRNIWKTITLKKKSKIPEPRCGHVGIPSTDGSRLYVVGGYNTNVLEDCWRCTLSESTPGVAKWHRMKVAALPSPFPRAMFRGCAGDDSSNELYVSCGTDGTTMLNDLWSLDLEKLQWTRLSQPNKKGSSAPSPVGRCNHAMTSFGSDILLYAGEAEEGLLGDLWLFDRPTRLWVVPQFAEGPLPRPRCSHMVAQIKSRCSVAIFGGCGAFRFDTSQGDFLQQQEECHTEESASPENREDSRIEDEEGTIPLNDLWLLTRNHMDGKFLWTEVECGFGPSPRSLGAFTGLSGGNLLLFGGYGLHEVQHDETEDEDIVARLQKDDQPEEERGIETSYLGDTWVYSFGKETWLEIGMSEPRNGHSVTEHGSMILTYGGYCDAGFLGDVEFCGSDILGHLLENGVEVTKGLGESLLREDENTEDLKPPAVSIFEDPSKECSQDTTNCDMATAGDENMTVQKKILELPIKSNSDGEETTPIQTQRAHSDGQQNLSAHLSERVDAVTIEDILIEHVPPDISPANPGKSAEALMSKTNKPNTNP